MAIQWGAWEGASPNRIRVGIDLDWTEGDGSGNVTHSSGQAQANIDIYVDVEGNWSDTQTLTFGGSISGSVTFDNNQSSSQVKRASKVYEYDYPSSSYGSSPGDRTFTASLSGAYNGATPSKSLTSAIPARPYGTPAAPGSVSVSRVSADSAKITWANKDATGEPWDTVRVEVDAGANDVWNGDQGTTGGGGTSLTASALGGNSQFKWRVRAENSVGDSSWVETGVYYTDPNPPTGLTRTQGAGAQQNLAWTNGANAAFNATTEIYVTRDGGTTWTLLTTAAAGATSYIDTAASASQKTAYRARHKVASGAQGTVYSTYSADTTMTQGVTSAPNPPTNLSPSADALITPSQARIFTWQYNSTDTTAQTAYQVQWRVVGNANWNVLAKFASSGAAWIAAASTFPDNSTIEWQVRTWGSATTGGSDSTGASTYSASATFKTVGDPNAARANKRVMRLDLETGEVETAPVMALPPIGSMLMFAGGSAPQGWLLCQGQSLLRTDYPDLFAVISTTYGAADSTHFNLPDLRDRAPVGSGGAKGLGERGGSASSAIGTANLPKHTHDLGNHTHGMAHDHNTYHNTTSGSSPSTFLTANSTGRVSDANLVALSNKATTDAPSTNTSGDGGFANTALDVQNPYVGINFIIKA